MIRVGRITLVLLALLMVPAVTFAQKDTRQTREASKFIGLAMTKQDAAERAEMYRQAMEHLRQGMTEDAQNAKVWLLAGSALAALGEMAEADQAFDRAVELHPEYAAEVEGERESAWIEAFNRGIQLMDEQRYPEAITALEGAQAIYAQRPEALMNLGALYSNAGDNAKAVQALTDAIAATNGPLFEQLDAEQQAEWVRFRGLAQANIAQIQAQQGVQYFQEQRFDSAAVAFLAATETNPNARDYWFNYGQSLWALATPLEEQLDSVAKTQADSARIITQLRDLYGKIQHVAQKSREFDPNNEVLYLMEARTHRMSGQFDPAQREAGQAAALRLLEAHEALAVSLDQIGVVPGAEGTVTISGNLKNIKATEGSPVTIRFTLLALDGTTVGQHEVSVNAPAAEQTAQFEAQATVTGEVAGWKYVIGS
ncbi:MAG TPA: tetratricopeptide repeat protein [Longimicrobiales bacterium]